MDLEATRLKNRNELLNMSLDMLEYHIKHFSPDLYEEALKLAECDSHNMILRHGDRIKDDERTLRCLQSMVLYYRGLYKKDCRVWMYKSILSLPPAQALNTSNNNESIYVGTKQTNNTTKGVHLAERPVTVSNDPFRERSLFTETDYRNRRHTSSLSHLCANQQEECKPISDPVLHRPDSASQDSSSTVSSATTRTNKDVSRRSKLVSRSDTFLLRFRPYVDCSKSSSSLSRLADETDSFSEGVDENDQNMLRAAVTSDGNNTILGLPGQRMICFEEESGHCLSISSTPSHLSLTNVSECSSYADLNSNTRYRADLNSNSCNGADLNSNSRCGADLNCNSSCVADLNSNSRCGADLNCNSRCGADLNCNSCCGTDLNCNSGCGADLNCNSHLGADRGENCFCMSNSEHASHPGTSCPPDHLIPD